VSNNDTDITVELGETGGARITVPSYPRESLSIYRIDGLQSTALVTRGVTGSSEILVPDDALDSAIEALERLRGQRDEARGHQFLTALRLTEGGRELADAADRGRAA
jgi:hypothetical protein